MASASYLDFDLLIERSGENTYRARVLSSPAGQANGDITLPFSQIELENYLLRIGRPRRGVRRLESPEMETAKIFGGQLFKSVFSDELMSALRSSLDEAKKQNQGLRIRLRLNDAPELVNLPWEYLYNPSLNRFLSLSVNTPLVRYLELPERIAPLTVTLPLRILVMISSPSDYPKLDVEQEWVNLKSALCGLEERGLVVLERLETASPVELQYQLRRNEYHIFHFIGHGGFNEQAQDGVLLFEDEGKRGRQLSGQFLGTLLHDEQTLRLVILNACEGGRSGSSDPFAGVAQSLVQQGIPAVIAMQFEITDEAAIAFAREFYTAIAEGFPVDAAMSEARKAIFSLGNDIEWGTPVLYMRAPDGQIFEVNKSEQASQAPVKLPPAERTQTPSSSPHRTAARESNVDLEALYVDGLSAYWLKDWAHAWEHFRQVEEVDPTYKDLPAKLAEVKQHLTIASLKTETDEAIQTKNWDSALAALEKLVQQAPGDPESAARLENTRREAQLDRLYTQAGQLYKVKQWAAVRNVFGQIHALQADYPDPDGLLEGANQELEKTKRAERLKVLYSQALVAMEEERWQDAVGAFKKIQELDRDYRDTNRLLENTQVKLAATTAPFAEQPAVETSAEEKFSEEKIQSVEAAQAPEMVTTPAIKSANLLDKLGLPRWLVFAGGGLIGVIILVAIILASNKPAPPMVVVEVPSPMPTATPPAPTPEPTEAPAATPTLHPTDTETPVEQPPVDRAGDSNINWVSDDFSTSNGTWSEEFLDNAYKVIEDGQYVFSLSNTGDYLASRIPVVNNPAFISFHATILALGEGDGSYSVYCHYPEVDQYYEIRLQAHTPDYYIYDGTAEAWLVEESSANLRTGDFAENDIQILCQPGFIELFINNNFETRVELGTISTPGFMELYVDTWDIVGPEGYRIAFDNIFVSNEFYENFTSNVHGWYEDEAAEFSVKIENGQNKFNLYEPDWYVWSYLPLDYAPTTVWFTANTAGVYGSYGVRCNYIDDENFYEVSFQSLSEDFTFTQVKNGEWIDLQDNQPFIPESLNLSGSTNTFQITCKPGLIQLYVNNDAEKQITFEDDSNEAGDIALFARSWEELGSNGYQVAFDNVGAVK
jgi:hypothetical protein